MTSALLGSLSLFDPKFSDYAVFSERLEQFFLANNITDEARKRAILLNTLNEECYVLLKNLCIPKAPKDKSFAELNELLLSHFSIVKSVFAERLKFYNARKDTSEKVSDWAAKVKSLAANCKFSSAMLDIVMRDIFVIGMGENKIMDKLFEEDASKDSLSMSKVISIALVKESALTEQSGRLSMDRPSTTSSSLEEVEELHFNKNEQSSARVKSRGSNQSAAGQSRGQSRGHNYDKRYSASNSCCSVCGRGNHKSTECYSRNFTCHRCGVKGHLAPMCKRSNVQHFLADNDAESDNSIENIFSFNEINIFDEKGNVKPIYVNLTVENIPMNFEADSGFAHAAISEKLYMKYFRAKKLFQNDLSLRDYVGITFKPIGFINLNIVHDEITTVLKTYVIQNGGPPLIGRNGLKSLNLGFCKVDNFQNNFFIDPSTKLDELVNHYAEIFDGKMGSFNKFKVSLKLKHDYVPKFFKARPVPFALKPKIEQEIARLVKNDVLVPVEFSEWATPIVPILKKNGSLRICGDFKITLNPQLEIQQYPLPRIEYLFSQLQGGEKFSKIDLSEAYQQINLSDESSKLVTISTHKGLFSYKRLPYGIHCAPSIFQNLLEQILVIPGVVSFIDDILITGRNDEEHIERLEKVFKRLKDCGLKVKKEKCAFLQESINYMGHVIDKNGLHPTQERVEAIQYSKIPSNVTELKSFLGMVNYYCKFIPNASTFLYPLYRLLRKNVDWIWSTECQKSFDGIKTHLVSPLVLTHFDSERQVKLTVDASSIGLGAIISHIYDDGSERPIAFASRLLNSSEISYSQIEKEAAAIIFGIKKFFQYLYGRKFLLFTDHKPLLTILGEKKGLPVFAANRLQRWAHILSAFNYEIKYISSDQNCADFLSRSSAPIIAAEYSNSFYFYGNEESDKISYLNYLENSDFPINFRIMKRETSKHLILGKVSLYVRTGWPPKCTSDELKPYFNRRFQITEEQGCLMWGYRLIVPSSFHQSILQELHSTHMGITKMKSLARSYFWWPNIDKQIENLANSCDTCAIYASNSPKAPLISWDWPIRAWTRLHVDFFGPCLNKNFLVVEDATSKWIECFEVKNITASTTIKVLRKLFARFGLPKELCSDNASTFCSREFKFFVEQFGIKHTTGAPYHPETNGLAESGVKIMKRAMLKAHNDGVRDIDLILDSFLLQYRNTEHTTTGMSPAQLLFGRNLRTKFDLLLPSTEDVVREKQIRMEKPSMNKKDTIYSQGEKVWVRDYRENAQNWCRGKIHQVLGGRTYIVEADGGITWKRHTDQLKKYESASWNVTQNVIPQSSLIDTPSLPSSVSNIGIDSETQRDETSRVLRRRSQLRKPDRLQI